MYGFKSFGQKTVLSFDHPVTVIVGPNGSGKSNIADAIRWVLGEQSAKSLRGGKMEDVIFSGTDQKKPLNMAQVSIVLDNSDKELDIAYEEVQVTRKMFRSGETEYLLNKSPCRLKDIRTLFMDTGIGKEGYSIIGQGKIEEIVSAREQDRRVLFEEATGISKFRYQIEESTRKLLKTEENLVRVEDILESLRDQLSFLKTESDKAKRGMKLTTELEIHTIAFYQQEWSTGERALLELTEKKRSLEEKLQEENHIFERLQAQLEPLRVERDKVLEDLQSCEQALQKETRRADEASNEHRLSEQRSEFLTRDLERTLQEIESLESELKRLVSQQSAAVAEDDALKAALQDERTRIDAITADLEKLVKDTERQSEERERLESTRSKLEKQLQQAQIRLHAQKDAESYRMHRLDRLEKSLAEEQDRIRALESEMDRIRDEAKAFQEGLDKAVAAYTDGRERHKEYTGKIESIEASIRNENAQTEKDKARLNVLQAMERNHEGYQRPVQHLLRAASHNPELERRLIGPLGSLIKVEARVQVAIEIALGAALHHIVTPKAEYAKFLIEWLRREKIGRATFLPIDQIRAYPYRGDRPKESEAVGSALDFIQYDPSIQAILESLLGRTFIIEDMEAGIRFRKNRAYDKLRFVTLEGELLLPGGSMVGGFIQKDRAGILSRETEQERLQAHVEQSLARIRSMEAEHESLLSKQRELSTSLDEIANTRESQRSALQEKKQNLATLGAQLDVYMGQRAQTEQQLVQVAESKEDADLDRARTLLTDELETTEKALSKVEQTNKADESNRWRLQAEVTGLQSVHDTKIRDRLILVNRIKDLEEQTEEKRARLDSDRRQRDESKEQIKAETNKQKNLMREKVEAESAAHAFSAKLESLQVQWKDAQTEWENLEQSSRLAERSMRESEVELSTCAVRHASALEKSESFIETVARELDMERDIAHHELRTRTPIKTSRSKVKELKDALREIGPFSFETIERYESVQARVTFLTRQSEDLTKSSADLKTVIESLETKMRRQFRAGIREINDKFLKIFQILFDGGQAEIALVGEDVLEAGVQIIARPPGKTRQALSLLSGGEKSLTAVALLFAIFETRPSPFCVLDEIDAALDDANIARYKQYLESFRGRIQFVIISHRKQTMELADLLYGVTMQENSTSQIVPLLLTDKKAQSA